VSRVVLRDGTPRITYEMSELMIASLGSELEGFHAAAWQPYPQHRGKRLSAPAVHGSSPPGFTEIVEAADGLHAVITDWPAATSHVATWEETVPAECGYLYVGLEGDGRIEVEGIGYARRSGASCSVTVAPPGATHLWRTGPRVVRRGVCIAFHARYLHARYPSLLHRCSSTLGPWLSHGESRVRDFEVPLLPVMREATAALLSTRLEGQFRYAFVSTTVEQLVCLAVAALADREAATPVRLSVRDRDILRDIRCSLDENLADPSTVEELARQFGINRNKLRYGFRVLFGNSVGEYLLEQRMRIAFALLEQRVHCVSEVAARVGYTHVCNFTTAFKRRFGQTPSAIARKAG
jgi:AraC-like DNA-binding protein